MRILLVEDEEPKSRHIRDHLANTVPFANVTIARSHNSAIDAIEAKLPDLILLDMSLPTFDVHGREGGGRPQGFGGIEILRHMKLSDLACPVIVITGYEAFKTSSRGGPVDLAQLETELTAEFPEVFCGVLHYDSALEDWKHKLSSMLGILSLKEGMSRADPNC